MFYGTWFSSQGNRRSRWLSCESPRPSTLLLIWSLVLKFVEGLGPSRVRLVPWGPVSIFGVGKGNIIGGNKTPRQALNSMDKRGGRNPMDVSNASRT